MNTSTLLDALRIGTASLPLILAGTALGQGGFDFSDSAEDADTSDQPQAPAEGQVQDIQVPNDAQRIEATLDQDDIVTDNGQYLSFLSMDLTQGQTFHFLIEADGFPVMLNMQDNDGRAVMINGVGLDGRYINVTAPADGNYSLLIVGLEPNRGGNYSVRAWQGEPAFAPESDTPGPRPDPSDDEDAGHEGTQTIQSVLDADDIALDDGRYFAFHVVELTAGTTYDIDVTSAGMDVVGYLFDAADNQLATNDDAPQMGTNARMTYTPEATGNYSVGVSTAKPGQTGGYQVTVTPRGGSATGPGEEDVDAPAEHNIILNAAGEADGESLYYAGDFRLEAGQRVVVQTYDLSDGCDTILQLRRSTDPEAAHEDDPVVAENDDYAGLLYSRVVYTAEEAGDYYLAVGVYEASAGTFSVIVRDALPAPEPIVVEGVEIEKDGQVLLGDFEFAAGLNWIAFETYDLQNGVDTVIELRKTVDPERASDDDPIIATNDDFFSNDLSSRLYFQCEEAGLYYVRITNIGKNTGTCTFAISYEE